MEESNKKIYTDKEYCLHVWGPFACFTRPEMKVERVSYDVITPSAARAIFQAIFWKPAIRWEVTKIEVLAPIKRFAIKRNEVASIMSKGSKGIDITADRRQRASYILRDVDYRIYAKMIYIPLKNRSLECKKHYKDVYTDDERAAENPVKYQEIFERRANKGQCFTMPYLGCREFACSFEYVDWDNPKVPLEPKPIQESRDLSIMLYDMDFEEDEKCPPAMFYHPEMVNGVIIVPPRDSNEILR